jgi:2-dehydro-3-deoxygalactonokinase
MSLEFLALDWGTTSFRAYHVAADGSVKRQTASQAGILAVADQDFDAALEREIGSWDKALPVLASGMITSRQGWVELAYVECPAGPEDLAKAVVAVSTKTGRRLHFITGLHHDSASIGHDVMRSEETQVFGAAAPGARHFITPGTHSKWIDVEAGKIIRFATYMTGEMFSLMRQHSILGRLMTADEIDEDSFARGVTKAQADPAGLLHSLFSVRSLGLFQTLEPRALSSYLSGLLIGAEIAHALQSRSKQENYVILASPKIGDRYAKALDVVGVNSSYGDPQAIVKGLRKIGLAAGILS